MSNLIQEVSSLKKADGQIIADSYKVIKKIVQHSKFKPLKFFYDSKVEHAKDLIPFFEESFSLTSDEFKHIPGANYHKGLIGVFQTCELECDELIPPFVLLNGVTSPENVGSIVRTISGLGFKTIVVDDKSASPYLRRSIRVSMGNIVFLNVLRVKDSEEFLKTCPYPVYATANNENSVDLREWLPEEKSGFVIGSEGHGIDPHLYKHCKNTIRIPVLDEVEHLNAGHSCAIIASRYLFNSSK